MRILRGRMQYLLPQQWLSAIAGKISNSQIPWLKNFLIKRFMKSYMIDLSQSDLNQPDDYASFNLFFTRHLKTSLRPIAQKTSAIISPVDGFIAQIGQINQQQLIQAKNSYFSLDTFLANEDYAKVFNNGSFATIYLAPHNYHRVHMPLDGTLKETIYIPGKLFSVNQLTTSIVPNLFGRNERLVCIFDTAVGPIAVIMVGAMLVGNIQTVWGSYQRSNTIERRAMAEPLHLKKGDELGYFQLGSTVILLFPNNCIKWSERYKMNSTVEYGQILAEIIEK